MIHLRYDYSQGLGDFEGGDGGRISWRHLVCQGPYWEEHATEVAVHSDEEDEEDPIWQKAYSACDPDDYDIYPSELHRLPSHSFMGLTVLRASRQMYAEANRILWTTNTSSFGTGTTLKYFLMTRTFHRKGSIRHLRCKMDCRRPGPHKWSSALDIFNRPEDLAIQNLL